jgi:hypothetical protein
MTHGSIHLFGRLRSRWSWPALVAVLGAIGALPAVAMAAPSVSGTPQEGQTLTYSGDPSPSFINWERCAPNSASCIQIATAPQSTAYTLLPDDVRSVIEVVDNTGTSRPTLPVFPFLVTPVIAGPTAEGQTLTAVPQWSSTPPGGASFSYSWSRCTAAGTSCVGIPGANGQQYGLTALDVGDLIRVAVSDSEPSGAGQGPEAASTSSPVTTAGAASTTFLLTSPISATTNQLVTVIATVTSTSSAKPPNGTIAFSNRGKAIPGCGSIPADGQGQQSVTVTCLAAFAAGSSPEQLTAVFTPSPGSPVSASGSAPVSLTIRKDSTTSSIDVSSPTVALGSRETYTANVQGILGGSVKPSGTAEFLDHGKPIAGCTKSPLTATSIGSQASCAVRYSSSGSHAVSVSYPGDANYLGSASQSAPVTVRSISLGVVSSTMQWTFNVTPSYTGVLGLLIDSVSPGTNVLVRCHGRGCPFARQATTIRRSKRCVAESKGKVKCTEIRSTNVDLESGFRRRRLREGAQIAIFLTRPQWIGKYYQFTIRAGAPPRIRIACLAPGSTAPGVGC